MLFHNRQHEHCLFIYIFLMMNDDDYIVIGVNLDCYFSGIKDGLLTFFKLEDNFVLESI